MTSERLVTCWFLIPIVRDSKPRQKHHPTVWRKLEDALYREFRGKTGPERIIGFKDVELLPGGEIPEGSNERAEDESRKYTVFVLESEIDRLRALLQRAAKSFDQRCIASDVQGYPEFVYPGDDYLE